MKRFSIAAAFLAAALFSAVPDLYERDRPLFTIETQWFDVIFPEESTTAARYLASFADELYLEVATLLGTKPRHRLPVIITPDHEWINGYFTNYPYLRIVLYQAAIDMNSSLGSFEDDLRSLFMHELTHAVSLTIRGPVQEALVRIFGSPLGLSMYTTPLNFVEGVTVSFESLGGFGRTADPLAAAMIRQDLLEGQFKNFTQTMGTWDRYPGRSLYYIYGGYFSRYLQARFGMEKYAQLWQRIGSGMLARPLDDFLFVQGHFRKVYGLSLREAWTAFGEVMTPQMAVHASGPLITGLSAINALAVGGSSLYWADSAKGAVFSRDTSTSQTRRVFSTGAAVTRLDPHTDGSRMLVSTTGYEAGYARLSIHEWDGASGSLIRLPHRNLRDASYVPTREPSDATSRAFLAIQAQGYVTSLVLVSNDIVSVLLEGSQRVSYASPIAGPEGWIHVLIKEDGVVSVLRFRLDDFQLDDLTVTDLQRLQLPPGLGWVRYLSMDGGKLRFSWDDTAFYRLVELDGDRLRYQTVPTSGGVHQAVGILDDVYHLGHFSEGIAVCAFPDDRNQLGFQEVSARWEPATELAKNSSEYRLQERQTENTKLDRIPASRPDSPLLHAPLLPTPLPYSSLPWLLPRFWHPVLAGDADGLTLAGAAVYFADPIERISGYLSGGWNPRTGTPDHISGLDLDLTPLLVRFSLGDEFSPAPAELNPDRAIRQGKATVTVSGTYMPFAGGSVGFGFSGALQGWAESLTEFDRYGNWKLALAYASLYAGWQDMKQVFGKPGLREGYSLGATVRSLASVLPAWDGPLSGIEVQASMASGFLGFELTGNAGISLANGLLYGPAGATVQTPGLGAVSIPAYPRYEEFSGAPAGIWHMQAEVSLRPLSFEVQQAAGPLYTRRLNLRTGSRAMMTSGTDGEAGTGDNARSGYPVFDWSIFSRLELAFSPAIGVFALARPVAWIELWYRPLDETWGLGYVRELSF